jgi:DnaJ-class molecular chaperone
MPYDEIPDDYDDSWHDRLTQPRSCPHCIGGTIPAKNNYLSHTCPDCEGTGTIQPEYEEQ